MSVKHLQRYTDEFCGRYNIHQIDTIDQIDSTIHGLLGPTSMRVRYKFYSVFCPEILSKEIFSLSVDFYICFVDN